MAGSDGRKGRVGVQHPAHAGMAEIQRLALVVISLLRHRDGVANADLLEGPVPFQNGGANGLPVSQRNAAINDEADGFAEDRPAAAAEATA